MVLSDPATLGGDLGERQVGAAQLGAEGVHAHEDLRDLVVGELSFEHVHAVDVLADAAQPGETLAVFLASRVVEILDTSALRSGRSLSALKTSVTFKETDHGAIRFLTEAECVRLINACRADLRNLVRAALYTGARYGELARLAAANVHAEAGRIYISTTSKSGKGRYVPLSPEGEAFFADVIIGRTGAALVFTKEDGSPWGKNHHVRAFEEGNRVAKIEPAIGFHDLRHTYAICSPTFRGTRSTCWRKFSDMRTCALRRSTMRTSSTAL
jgi:hypothetical protein